MIGAIAGDIIGSVYEFDNIKTTVFPLFTRKSNYTDDTIMTVAVTDWLLYGGNLVQVMHRYGREFPCPMGGYGARFGQWLCETNPQPYNSWGNGSAMRVSAVGWAFGSLEKTLQVAEETAAVSHNHPEGIKGAQAVAAAIYLARTGKSKQAIREYIETTFLYDLNFSCDEIRPDKSKFATRPFSFIPSQTPISYPAVTTLPYLEVHVTVLSVIPPRFSIPRGKR